MMKIYHLPTTIRALAFDMDLTLYTNAEYGRYQIDSLIERLGKIRGLSFDEINREVEEVRKQWIEANNGEKPSLTKLLSLFGISVEESIRWREETYEPSRFLSEDKRLKESLEELSRFFILGVITNNPVLVARKTLAAMEVENCFSVLIGLDTCMAAKPDKKPFVKFSSLSGCSAETCVSVGDRYDIDLAPAMDTGMGGILVDGAEDVYGLPDLLAKYMPRTQGPT